MFSRLKRLWRLSLASGAHDPAKFRRWYPRKSEKQGQWRIVEDRTQRVICTGIIDGAEAFEIAASHNIHDAIQTREDWLWAKAKS